MAGRGLWMTADLGGSWTQVDRTHVFSSVFVHRSGVIYAAGRNADGVSDFDGPYVTGGLDLLASRDGGMSWAAVIPESRFLTLALLRLREESGSRLCDYRERDQGGRRSNLRRYRINGRHSIYGYLRRVSGPNCPTRNIFGPTSQPIIHHPVVISFAPASRITLNIPSAQKYRSQAYASSPGPRNINSALASE